MNLISVKNHPQWLEPAILFFQHHWASEVSKPVYDDCLRSMMNSPSPLPQWYILVDGHNIVGGAGLVTNDFVSRMDVWPYVVALIIEEEYRGKHLSKILIEYIKEDAKNLGFDKLYLCSDLVGFYEKMGFKYFAIGHHPWGETSSIFVCDLSFFSLNKQ